MGLCRSAKCSVEITVYLAKARNHSLRSGVAETFLIQQRPLVWSKISTSGLAGNRSQPQVWMNIFQQTVQTRSLHSTRDLIFLAIPSLDASTLPTVAAGVVAA